MSFRLPNSESSAVSNSLNGNASHSLSDLTAGGVINKSQVVTPSRRLEPSAVGARFDVRTKREGAPYVGKRALDLVITVPVFLFLLPLFACVWVMVRLTSSGPAIYWSERVGKEGVLFQMPKFRTMRIDAPILPREELTSAGDHDTAVGRFLRRSSIDELPQLWSVLIGDMSLIGPRPLLPIDPGVEERKLFPDSLSVAPGLSGLAQISGRNLVAPRRKARLDAFYASKASIVVDIKLMVATLGIVVRRVGIT